MFPLKNFIYFLLFSHTILPSSKKKVSFFEHTREIIAPEGMSEEAHKEWLWDCYCYPLDLNKASVEELSKFGILSDEQIFSFFEYVTKYGKLFSEDEIKAIPTWDKDTIIKISPFISVVDQRSPEKKHSIEKSLYHQKIWGYATPLWESKVHDFFINSAIDFHYLYQYGKKGALGFQIIKKKGSYLEDSYLGGYLLCKKVGIIEKLVLGRYTFRIGQGLAVGGWCKNPTGASVLILNPGSIRAKKTGNPKQGLLGISTILKKKENPILLFLSLSQKEYLVSGYENKRNKRVYFCSIPISYEPKKNPKSLKSTLAGVGVVCQKNSKKSFGIHYTAHALSLPFQTETKKGVLQKRQNHYITIFGTLPYYGYQLGSELVYQFPDQWAYLIGGNALFRKHLSIACQLHCVSDAYYSLESGYKEHKKASGYKHFYIGGKWTGDKSTSIMQGVSFSQKREQRTQQLQKGIDYTGQISYHMNSIQLRLIGNIKGKYQQTFESKKNKYKSLKKGIITLKCTDYALPYLTNGSTVFKCIMQKNIDKIYMSYGISQQIEYRKNAWHGKLGLCLFLAAEKMPIHLTQPKLGYPYTKAYGGKGLGLTIWARYYLRENTYIEGCWAWTFHKKKSKKKKNLKKKNLCKLYFGFTIIIPDDT